MNTARRDIAADAKRDVVQQVLADAMPLEQRTVGLELIVDGLADRILAAVSDDDVAALSIWLDGVCRRHAHNAPMPVIVTETFRRLASVAPLRLESGGAGRFLALEERATRIALERKISHAGRVGEKLDDVDACINDLIARTFETDPFLAEQSRAVSSWCVRLARRLGLTQSETVLAGRAGLLRDIGKIAIPEAILNAPRPLSPEERAGVERHPAEGAKIVAAIPLLADFLPAILSHHERIDGKGYPDGLRGEAIPLAARIVSVADCFNAMIGRRPYRPPLPPQIALEELDRIAGRQLDPEIVRAMADIITGQGSL